MKPSVMIRAGVFVAGLVYFTALTVPALSWVVHAMQPYRSTAKFAVSVYLVIGSVLSEILESKRGIIPKPVASVISPFALVSSQISLKAGPIQIIQAFGSLLAAKLLVRSMVLVFEINLLILFKSTLLTISIVLGLAKIKLLFLLLMLHAVRRASWYYLIAYCAICGGTVLVSGLSSTLVLGFAWRRIVLDDWSMYL